MKCMNGHELKDAFTPCLKCRREQDSEINFKCTCKYKRGEWFLKRGIKKYINGEIHFKCRICGWYYKHQYKEKSTEM